jgi:hypothetical protein
MKLASAGIDIRLLLFALAPCLAQPLLATPLALQVGGGIQTQFQFDGGAAGENLGSSVSAAGDVNGDGFADVIVGVPGASPGGLLVAGSACVYSGSNGALLHQFDGSAADDYFGNSVSGAGDVNADGFADLIVGARASDPGGLSSAGSAYVFSGATGAMLYQFDGTAQNGYLGESVSDAGDVNGDGYDDLIVGASGSDAGGLHFNGLANVYSGATGLLLYQFIGHAWAEHFGSAVSGAGDLDSDGFDDLIIGAWGARAHSGSAYVYSGATGLLLYQFDGAANDDFGQSVSDAGDVNGDGVDDIIIGASGASPFGSGYPGLAYVYSGATSELLHEFEGGATSDLRGFPVSGAGDVDGDGYADLIIGAKNRGPVGIWSAGSASLYSGATGALLYKFVGNAIDDYMGASVSGAGDVNNDGFAEVIVGAMGADPMGINSAGSAYVFSFHPFLIPDAYSVSASTGGTLNFQIDFPDAAIFDEYKILISITGTGPTSYGVEIPLTRDFMVNRTFLGDYPFPTHYGMQGTLDPYGKASAQIVAPAGLPQSLIGRTNWLAAIASPPGSVPEFSSVAVPITITP